MKILFVQNTCAEQLGIMSIAAIARRKGHHVVLAYGRDKHILHSACNFKPDIVGFSVITGFQKRWIRTAQAIKKLLNPEPLVVFGGPHPTFFPEVILEKGVDLACRGEGEGAFAEFLDAYVAGERNFEGIRNLVTKKGDKYKVEPMRPLAHLDDLPFPDREISFKHSFIRKDPSIHFLTSRGCHFSCTFCYSSRIREICQGLGPYVRLRTVENLLDEIDQVNKRWNIKCISFIDDTIALDQEWLFKFLEIYSRRFHFPFFCQIRANEVTIDVAQALKDAGCYRVSFGIESGVEGIRNNMLKKNLSDECIRKTADIFHKVGLPFQTSNMMGIPDERLKDAIRTLQFNIEIGADIAWTSLFQPYPGTELGEKAVQKGLIRDFPNDEKIAEAHTDSILKQPEIKQIVRLHKFAYVAVKFPKLLPYILKLINHDHPLLYYCIHRLSYFWYFFCRERMLSWPRIFSEALVALHYY